jgi:hypothetical protein
MYYVGIEVLTAVSIKSSVFKNVTLGYRALYASIHSLDHFQSIGHEPNRIGKDGCRDVTCSRVTIVTVLNVK